jgi:hypothetical protein
MKLMIAVRISGALLLLVFTVCLAARNWTPEVYKPVITIGVGGLIALLVTLLTVLRPSVEERVFVSSVIVDERMHLPAAVGVVGSPVPDVDAPLQNRTTARHQVLGWLSQREPFPVDPDERRDALAAEFFEYKLLLDLADSIGSDAQNIEIGPDEHGINRMAVSIRRRMLPPRHRRVLGDRVLEWLKGNRLSQLPIESEQWKRRGLGLPAGAEMVLRTGMNGTIPERIVTITVPGAIEITLRTEGRGSPGIGTLPPLVVVDPEVAKHYSTYGIVVTMRCHFQWLSAASPDMPGYKR